jgi:aldehyde:ferredoxin oxidoreductase
MGSKKLKGMVVTGDGEIEIADRERFNAVRKNITTLLKTDWKKWADMWRRYETASDLRITNELAIIPTRNWQTGRFEGWQGIDKSTTPMGWPENNRTCGPHCPTPGCREVEVKEGPYKGAQSDIEWETIYAFGSTCGVDKMEAILAASQICDEFGIDTMTAGITIGFAMECFEKGLISNEDTDGIELRFGNDQAMIAALKKMVAGEGFGKRLAMGTKKLSGEIKDSEPFAMHVKGLELGGYECRGLNAQALQFAINNRGGCHQGYGVPARVEGPDGSGMETKGKGQLVKSLAIDKVMMDSLPFCLFAGRRFMALPTVAEVMTAITGESWSSEELEEIGMRVMCLERLFNMREGITRKDDTLPERLLKEPKPDGPSEGYVVPLEELLDSYYQVMGYDPATGNPTDELLKQLEIEK